MHSIHLDTLPPQARLELLDFYEFLLNKYAAAETPPKNPGQDTQLPLGELALRLFGEAAGVDLELPRHSPHEPMELTQ